jgi:hypothetical protein
MLKGKEEDSSYYISGKENVMNRSKEIFVPLLLTTLQ